MKKLQAYGLITALIGALYATYWAVTYYQAKQLQNFPTGNITKEQFVQTYPNVDRAFRFLDFRPYDDDYSDMQQPPGQHILRHMLRHSWTGVALLLLGVVLGTMPAKTTSRRVILYTAVIGLFASLVKISTYPPIVWLFWNGTGK